MPNKVGRGGDHGGRRPLKYGEETIPVVFRVPKSKVSIFKTLVNKILSKWIKK
jgi:hypothetical protein